MWSRKRLLKKEKKHRLRKVSLISIVFSGVLGIAMMIIGIILIVNEPIFTSPLPLFQSWRDAQKKEDTVKEIEKQLKSKSIIYESVTRETSSRYKIILEGNGEVFINPEKGIAEQLSSLQVILSRLTMEGKKFKRLDLTYDRPVIVLQ